MTIDHPHHSPRPAVRTPRTPAFAQHDRMRSDKTFVGLLLMLLVCRTGTTARAKTFEPRRRRRTVPLIVNTHSLARELAQRFDQAAGQGPARLDKATLRQLGELARLAVVEPINKPTKEAVGKAIMAARNHAAALQHGATKFLGRHRRGPLAWRVRRLKKRAHTQVTALDALLRKVGPETEDVQHPTKAALDVYHGLSELRLSRRIRRWIGVPGRIVEALANMLTPLKNAAETRPRGHSERFH